MQTQQTSRAIIFNTRTQIISIKRTIYSTNTPYEYYTFPGGHVEANESFEDTVVREVEEELGVKVRIVKQIADIYVKDINRHEKFFECEYISGEFGTGTGVEFTQPDIEKYGKYEISYIDISKLDEYNLLPREIVEIIKKDYLE